MADEWQLALLKSSVKEWNEWRRANPDVRVDLSKANLSNIHLSGGNVRLGANLSGADLSGNNFHSVYFTGANLSGANLRGANLCSSDPNDSDLLRAKRNGAKIQNTASFFNADLSGADLRNADFYSVYLNSANLSDADLRGADLRGADLTGANLRNADLRGTNLRNADLTGANLNNAKQGRFFQKKTTSKPQMSQPSSPINWLSLVQTYGSTLLVTAATLASIIQGLDVVERRWREHQEKHQQQTPHPASSKMPLSDTDITDILLVMDDGSHHEFKCWVSDPDSLRKYIDAFSDPTSKVKPLSVVFRKRKGRTLSVNITQDGKDNKQLNVILGYLDAAPHP